MNRKRILFAASLSILVVSIIAVTSRDGSTASTTASNTGFKDSPRTKWTYGSVFTVGSASTPTPTTCGTIYDAVGDFSATSNPNSSWSYGWETSLGGAFTPYTLVNSTFTQGIDYLGGPDSSCGAPFFPLVAFNHTGSTLDYSSGVSQPANMLSLHPSCNGKLSVVRWTAPTTGWFDVVGLFQGIDTRNTSTDVHVLQNSGTSLLSGNINGFGNQAPFDLRPYLSAGDTLDFVVGWGSNANYNADSTGLAVTITASPVFNIADGDVAGLIAAINSANASGCPTTINLAPNGHYVLTAVAETPPEFNSPGAVGLPVIRGTVTIDGNGATIQRSTVTGTPDFVPLAVSGRTASCGNSSCFTNPSLTLNQTIISGGSRGGLQLNSATALVQDSTITQNTGGGITNACGALTLLNSTVSYNTSANAYGGGGIFLWGFSCAPGTPNANISFSTIFENQNTSGTTAGGDPYGPGYAIADAFGNPSDIIIKNSILASPTRAFYPASACYGITPISGGHNIADDGSCGLTGPGDMQNTNPLLGPLANNGGPTPTHLPLCNSPAINAVPIADSKDVNGVTITTDQRGVSRPVGVASDIGSVEAASTVTVTIPSSAGPWSQGVNPTFNYGVHDNGPPVEIDAASGLAFTPGGTLTVSYISGMVQAGVSYPFNDANGLPGNVTNNYDAANGRFPAFYMNPGPDVLSMELVGTFANNGVIVGQPFPIGNGPTALTVPSGANQLLLGINDNFYGDNSGSFTVTIIGGSTNTSPTVSCPSPFSAFADSNCQAAVPDVLSGVTASGSCNGPITLSQSPAAGTLVGLGVTEITVTATDAANNSSSCTTTFTVTDSTPPTIAPMSNITTTTDPGECTARVNFAPTVSDNCSGVSFSCSTPSGSAFPIGTTGVTCTATDASGNTAATSFNVTVNNPAPTVSINSPASGAIFAVGTNVTFGGTFVDNAGDLHSAQWSFASNSQNIVQSGVIDETTRTVSANHTFTSAGVYLITLMLTDQCGNSATTDVTGPDGLTAMVVIYDPNGGFVTGGGWIDSPMGAYTSDSSLSGRASFGFVSKYNNGATTPTGNTEFQFRVASFNFRSTVYEWLVVAGARAQFKGSGTINGAGDYGFMLTAIDGQLNGDGGADKFRIKIWNKNDGGLIYDNLLNAPDSSDPTTLLGGGSIVIHK